MVRRMGLLETIKERTTGETGFALVDDDGNDIGFMGVTPAEEGSKNAVIGAPTQEIEVCSGVAIDATVSVLIACMGL